MTETLITPDELERMPDADQYELVDGALVERHVSIESSEVAVNITTLLKVEAKRTGLASVYGQDLGYRCYADDPTKVRKPDGSVVVKPRSDGIDRSRGYMPIPADLVVEVVSPNDLAEDLDDKVREYLAAGFLTVWVVYPSSETVIVYRADERSSLRLTGDDEITGDAALPEFRCKVSAFFEP